MNQQAVLPTIIDSPEMLDNALAVLGDLDATVNAAGAELDQALARVRDEFSPRFFMLVNGQEVPIKELRENLVMLIQRYCVKHRKELLPGDKKSAQLSHGTIGFRKAKDKVEDLPQEDELKDKGLLARCLKAVASVADTLTLKLGKVLLTSLVKVAVTWNKSEILKAFNEGKVTASQLEKQGLEVIRGEDEFYCEPKSEKRAA